MTSDTSFHVLIAGGGVAALEGALALRELAGHRISTTLLAPEPEFVYRPMRVLEPFGHSLAHHYDLDEIAADIGAELIRTRSLGSTPRPGSSTPPTAPSFPTTRCCSPPERWPPHGSTTH